MLKLQFCSFTVHANVCTCAHRYRKVGETQVLVGKCKVGETAIGQLVEIIINLLYELQHCLNQNSFYQIIFNSEQNYFVLP